MSVSPVTDQCTACLPTRGLRRADPIRADLELIEGDAFTGNRLTRLWTACRSRYLSHDVQEDRVLVLAYHAAEDRPDLRALIVQAQQWNAMKDSEITAWDGVVGQILAMFRSIAGQVESIVTGRAQSAGEGQS